ncbi:MAG: hypothetical protein WD717_04810 [Nitrosarchaeum sp.]
MKNTITIAVIAIIVAVGAGFAGFSFASNASSLNQPVLATSALINGHLQLIVTDSEGQIKAYRQTDNAITLTGENCVAKMLFKGPTTTGTGVCTGAITQPFTYIAVGTGTGSDTPVIADLVSETTTSNLGRALGSVTIANATASGTGSSGASIATITKSFSPSATVVVTEAGLFNDTKSGTDGMFARKTFTGVTVNNLDTLTVTWAVSIGNTTSFN